MNDFLEWQDMLSSSASDYTEALVEEAKTFKTPEAGVNMLKGLKQDFPNGYSGTVDQAIINVMNQVINDAIREVCKQAMKQKWSD